MYTIFQFVTLLFLASVGLTSAPRLHKVDVAIIGGGVAGTYAAVRLHDQKRSLVLIEPHDYLGGNTETYTDPATNTPIDLGTRIYPNTSTVRNYYARFGIPLGHYDLSVPGTTRYLDFNTAELVRESSSLTPTPQEQAAAFAAYDAQWKKYPFLTSITYRLPESIPADLLLPFGQFVQKYNLTATWPIISLFLEGFGNLTAEPTLYVFRQFGAGFLDTVAKNGFLTTASFNSSLLYTAAQKLLGPSVLLQSRITSLSRPPRGPAIITVSTPNGVEIIHAKRILSAFPQLLSNFDGWDLDELEKSRFSRFTHSGWFTGLLRNTGIPANLTLQAASANTPFNEPVLPGIYNIGPTSSPGLLNVYYGTIANYTIESVKSAIVASIYRLRTAGVIPPGGDVEFAVLRSHTPYHLRVSVEDIEAGFYNVLYGLQGYRRTFYTGAAFSQQMANSVWEYTEGILWVLVMGL